VIININISQLPARVELDDTISDVEDINLICSLILLERKLVKFPVTSDYSRLSVKDLKDNFSLQEISNLCYIVHFLFPDNYVLNN
jgi:hypothetical protein